jgi:hypothetical protein
MKRILSILTFLILPLLTACSIVGRESTVRLDQPAPASSLPPPSPVGANLFAFGPPQVAVMGSLLIDETRGRLYAPAQVNTEPKLAVLDASKGELIAAYDEWGELALDSARDVLVIDQGIGDVRLIRATTGETLAAVDLPPQDEPPRPQVNARSGLIYAFRGATIYFIDPAIGQVVQTTPLSVDSTVCDTPAGDATVYQSAYDVTADRLYLSFITYVCTPWVSLTVVAYDGTDLTEIGRTDVELHHQFAPYNGDVFGVSISRLGPMLRFAWDGETRWYEESASVEAPATGVVVDTKRRLIYEAVGETITIIDPRDGAQTAQVHVPLLAEGRLVGHNPANDMLYFVGQSDRLYLWPAANLFGQQTAPVAVPSPLPLAAVRAIALPPNWVAEQTMAALIDNGDCPVDGGRLFLMIDPQAGWVESTIGADGACEAVAEILFSPDYARDSLIFVAANQPATILRSVDAGRSWTAAETPFPEGATFSALLPSPNYASDQTLYALTSAGLLYRSRDGGRTWRLLDQRLDHVTVAGNLGPALQLFGSYGSRILRSNVSGDDWVDVGTTPNSEPLALLRAAPSTGESPILYAFTTGGSFARSLDSGATWLPVLETSPGLARLAIAVDRPEDTRPVFLLNNRDVNSSYDGMASIGSSTGASEASRYRPTAIALSPDFAAAPYLFVGTADGQIIRVRVGVSP